MKTNSLFKVMVLLVINSSFLPFLSINAQNVPAKTWSFGVRINTDYAYFGLSTASDGSIFTAGGGDASNQNFTIRKYNSNGGFVFTKSYVSRNKGKGSVNVDANNDVFVMSTFSEELRLTNDTIYTIPASKKYSFVGKFSGSNGNDIWVKSMPIETPVYHQLLDNNNYLIAYSSAAGPFTFDGNVITTLTVPSTVFIELSNSNGAVINHWSMPNTLLTNCRIMNFSNSKLVIYDFARPPIGLGGGEYWRRSLYNLTSGIYIKRDSVLYKSQYRNITKSMEALPLSYNKLNGDLYLSVSSGADFNIFNLDTIASSQNAVFHFDSNQTILQVNRIPYSASMIEVRDTNLVIGTRAFSNPNYVWMYSDTINLFSNQWCYWITQSNLNFENRKHGFMTTDSWQTGLELRDIEISSTGDVFVLGFHENDIIFPPTVVRALNRSWKHLSAFGKLDLGISVGLVNNKKQLSQEIKVFPNPFENQFTIQEPGVYTYRLYSVRGELLLEGRGSETTLISTEKLNQGTYILSVQTNRGVITKKLIK